MIVNRFPGYAQNERHFNTTHILLTFIFQLSLFTLLSCTQFFQDKVAKTDGLPGTKLSDLINEKTEITQLDAPEEINVSTYLSTDSIFVSWSSVSTATYYRIERAIATEADSSGNFQMPDEAEFEVLNKFVYGTSYTDTILSNPTYKNEEYNYRYFYRVSAENPRNDYDSSEYTTSAAGALFAPVTTISATQGEDSSYIKVSWEKTAGASSYKIYRSQYSDGSGSSLIATVTANQNWYKNEIDSAAQGTEFYYSVYALNSQGYTTPVSPVALGYSLVDGAPGKVKNVSVTKGRGETTDSISISWDSVSGSDVKYAVYRTSSADSSSTLLKDGLETNSYTDSKNLTQNVYYYYQVLAYVYDDDGTTKLKGPVSESSSTDSNPCEGYILSPPYSLSVVYDSSDDSKCVLTFPAALGSSECPKDSGLSPSYNSYSYKIYSCDTQTGSFTDTGASFDDGSLVSSDGYYSVTADYAKFYKISTVKGETESSLGSVAAPAPKSATNLSVTKTENLSDSASDWSANDNNVYPVKITWTAPDGGADGGYYLYRSTKASSGFRKVTDDPIPANSTEYYDNYDSAKPGIYYYYRVLSLNELKQGSNYSSVDYGYGAITNDEYMRQYNKTIKNSHKKFTYMHKSGTNALGSESISGTLNGSASYKASMSGLGARIIMYYDGYTDYYINDDSSLGYYFVCTGNTNTSASMDASGSMDGTVYCTGMYPGSVGYDGIEIKGGAAGGGYYVIKQDCFDSSENISWIVGEE